TCRKRSRTRFASLLAPSLYRPKLPLHRLLLALPQRHRRVTRPSSLQHVPREHCMVSDALRAVLPQPSTCFVSPSSGRLPAQTPFMHLHGTFSALYTTRVSARPRIQPRLYTATEKPQACCQPTHPPHHLLGRQHLTRRRPPMRSQLSRTCTTWATL
ncbi:hypothetical protein BCR44DRAFT_1440760, partial [Catenaria anguillulae PL171]